MKKILIAFLCFLSIGLSQSKPVVGIGEILYNGRNQSAYRTELESRLVATNKFDIIERQRLNDILKEQGLGMSGIVDGSGKIGGIGGVDYLIYGQITSFTTKKIKDSDYYKVKGKLSIKVVDVQTGKIVISKIVSEDETDDDTDKAAVDIRKGLTKKIAKYIALQIFPIKVAQRQGDLVYINYGKIMISSKGAYEVFKMCGGFKDPDTGEIIGAQKTYIGLVDIDKREEKYSTGKIVHSLQPIQTGDQLQNISSREYKKFQKKYKLGKYK